MSKEIKIGIIAIIIIAGSIWGFNFLKGKNLLDTGTRTFKVEYAKIGGLSRSSSVTINGLKVGKVDKIEFDTSEETRGHLIVTFTVENEFEFSKNSVVRIYSPNPLSGSNLAIVPDYEGEIAVSGDLLKGEMEESLFTSIGERLNPLQQKIEKVIVRADTLFSGINKILNDKTIAGINSSVSNLAATINDIRKTVKTVNAMVVDNQENLKITLSNTKTITGNLSRLSDSLTTVNINQIVQKAENAVDNFNKLSKKMNSGEGSIAKLINDKKMYDNLEAATKELEELLRDIKLNPKRYVHFSIFGKNPGPYEEVEKVKE
ncbi:MCE family protein [Polaribacter batillariae]|uniref:MCE family protein n=1 Tax=Polaribacter batillariae TaxID=2808900 RepID=A0ABX7SX20_9FLAO|nr:MlaD family protein [Polaribacter batillariae]QTD37379.1 MCE family protein [Polaribacter batillariae]